MTQIQVHKSPSLLKHKLSKTEPSVPGKLPKVAFGVTLLEFNDDIPILREKHLEAYCKRQAEEKKQAEEQRQRPTPPPPPPPPVALSTQSSSKQKKIPKLIIRTPNSTPIRTPITTPTISPPKEQSEHQDKRKGAFQCQSPRLSLSSSDDEEKLIQTTKRIKKQQLREDTPPPSPPSKRSSSSSSISTNIRKLDLPRKVPQPTTDQSRSNPSKSHQISQDRLDEIANDLASDISDNDNSVGDSGDESDKDLPVIEQAACDPFDDKLILTGPEEDEFRQYDNDENDESETKFSKNMKKIRTETTTTTTTKAPAPPRPPLVQQPFSRQKKQPPVSEPTSVKQIKKAPKLEPPKELTPEDLDKFINEKSWRLVYMEMNRNQSTFKTNETARAALKKAVIECLNHDETYELINLIRLVFEYEYPEDFSFWEMLIGKLKRKVSPHSLNHRFKCEVDPKLVINNYNLVIQEICKHFNSSSKMSNVRIPFHLASYLAIFGHEKSTPARLTSAPNMACIAPYMNVKKDLSQENRDPTTSRDVSLTKIANGRMHFNIVSTRRESKWNPMFLSQK